MNCLHCKTTIRNGERFCTNCGLAATASVKAATATVADNSEMTVVRADRLVGRLLDAKYELLARLGKGSMGTVYRARRIFIGDEVAIKVLRRNFVAEPDAIGRFRREARTAAMLRHPNVVAIYDYREVYGEEAQTYIVMELAPGATLGQLLKRDGRFAPGRAIALMCGICAGVGAAHQHGIVHRDLKPDNIIVGPPHNQAQAETVKVVDFGIAKLRDLAAVRTLTQAGMVIGTPYYMSPEQRLGDDLDVRSDVYSLGTVLYEMLAGRRPFIARTPTGVIAKQVTEAPPPLPPHLGIPPGVEAVLMRALAKDPAARPADATAFARELQAALSPGNHRPLAGAALASKRSSFKPISYALIVAIMLLSIGIGTWIRLAGLQPPEPNLKAVLVNTQSDSPDAPSRTPGADRESIRPGKRRGLPPSATPPPGDSGTPSVKTAVVNKNRNR